MVTQLVLHKKSTNVDDYQADYQECDVSFTVDSYIFPRVTELDLFSRVRTRHATDPRNFVM